MVLYEGKKVEIEELKGRYYFIQLPAHVFHAVPRIIKESLREEIQMRGWNENNVVVSDADFLQLKLEEE